MPHPVFRTDRYILIFDYPLAPDDVGVALVDTGAVEDGSVYMVGDREPLLRTTPRGKRDWNKIKRFAQKAAKENGNLSVIVSWECPHCGQSVGRDYYMVTDETWALAEVPIDSQLHLLCLQERIGRPLTIEDFTEAPVNMLIHFGYGLAPKPS